MWTYALRLAVLKQLSVWIDTDYPISTVDLRDNKFDPAELGKAEAMADQQYHTTSAMWQVAVRCLCSVAGGGARPGVAGRAPASRPTS